MQVHVWEAVLNVKVLTHEVDVHSPVIAVQEVQFAEQAKQLFCPSLYWPALQVVIVVHCPVALIKY